jgi:hypothetical protein
MVARTPSFPEYRGHPPQLGLMRAEHGNLVRVRLSASSWAGGKPTVRGAEFPGGNMPKKRMPVAERQQESATSFDRFLHR